MGIEYAQITQSIIEAIEAGADSYRMPWVRTGSALDAPVNALSGRLYQGINTLLLWAEATRRGYETGRWATYQQWLAAGAQVRAGERGTSVLLWKRFALSSRSEDEEDTGAQRERSWGRTFTVFNADQVIGGPSPREPRPQLARVRHAERFFLSLRAKVREGGDQAFYDRVSDTIHVPSIEQFRTAEAYYGVLAHELVHWSGASDRTGRDLTGRFGTEAYAMEELIAELGAAFLTAELELKTQARRDHAPYIGTWLTVLKRDERAIFTAASGAQSAVHFLKKLSDGTSPDGDCLAQSHQ